jgi:hypothetical protein
MGWTTRFFGCHPAWRTISPSLPEQRALCNQSVLEQN